MKTRLLLLAGLLLAGVAHAQFGVRVGTNYASLSDSGPRNARYASTDGRVGYQVGVFYEKKISARFSIIPEVQFSRQRISLDMIDYDPLAAVEQATYQIGLSYLSVPILARTQLGKFYVEIGPQSSFLLSAREKGVENEYPLFSSYRDPAGGTPFDRRVTNRYQRYDFGTAAGFGVRLPAGLELGLRACAGLLSVTNGARSTYRGELKNAAFQANVAYQFKH